MVGIYKITNKLNEKCYIGQSKHIETRWKEHRYGQGYTKRRTTLYSAFNKYGIENFEFEVLEECEESELDNLEKYYIKKFNSFESGYNMNNGGKRVHVEHTKEWHRKIGEKHKGKIVSDEVRKKISNSLKGHTLSEHTKELLRISSTGRVKSENEIQKISDKVSKPIIQFDLSGNFIKSYKNARIASAETNINFSNISSCCNGKRKKAGGYIWKFSEVICNE